MANAATMYLVNQQLRTVIQRPYAEPARRVTTRSERRKAEAAEAAAKAEAAAAEAAEATEAAAKAAAKAADVEKPEVEDLREEP